MPKKGITPTTRKPASTPTPTPAPTPTTTPIVTPGRSDNKGPFESLKPQRSARDMSKKKSGEPIPETPLENKDKDEDPSTTEGIDDDDPEDQYSVHTSRLDPDFERILRAILIVRDGDTHEAFDALFHQGVFSWNHFINIDPETISSLSKQGPKKGIRFPVMHATQARLKSLLFLYFETAQERPTLSEISEYYTEELIGDYLRKERMERIKALKEATEVNATTAIASHPSVSIPQFQQSSSSYGKSKTEKQLENWDKKKRDKKDFDKLVRNENYNAWKEAFVQQLKDERMLFFTDPDPKYDRDAITDEYELELYSWKNEFLWGVLLHVIQLPTARGILDTFKKDNPGEEADARAAFIAIDTRMRKGLLQIHSTSTLLIELTTFTINGFTGTRTNFLTTWYAKLRDL